MSTPNTTGPPKEDHSFADAHVTFAIDRSGSTQGRTLLCELSFVRQVSRLLSDSSRPSTAVIPWNNSVDGVLRLDELSSIHSGGLTDPRAILNNKATHAAVAMSSVWFLMTDGLIPDQFQKSFADMIPKAGIHGISCVTVIFGVPKAGGPQSCDISVGVSLFAICPNALFLFCDTRTNDVSILQAKGVFNCLLEESPNPIIDDSTSWSSLPRMVVASLADVVVPAPKLLGADEVALSDSLTVNLDHLLENKLGEEVNNRIFSDAAALYGVTLSSTSRGGKRKFQDWVQTQQMAVQDPKHRPRTDRGGAARTAFKAITRHLRAGELVPYLTSRNLQRAHLNNMKALVRSYEHQTRQAKVRDMQINGALMQSNRPVAYATSLSNTSRHLTHTLVSEDEDSDSDIDFDADFDKVSRELDDKPGKRLKQSASDDEDARGMANWVGVHSCGPPGGEVKNALPPRAGGDDADGADAQKSLLGKFVCRTEPEKRKRGWGKLEHSLRGDPGLKGLLYTPGFRNTEGSFRGLCSVCGTENITLAWLFRSEMAASSQLPAELTFPLLTGSRPEADTVSTTVCCEPCSTYCVASRQEPPGGVVVAALPMVSYEENSNEYIRTLSKIYGPAPAEVGQIFLSSLLHKSAKLKGAAGGHALFLEAAKWTCLDLLENVPTGRGLPVSGTRPDQPLTETILRGFNDIADPASPIIRYPLAGFIELLHAASLVRVSSALRRAAAFRRYLFAITESLVGALAAAAKDTGDTAAVMKQAKEPLWEELDDPDMVLVSADKASADGSPNDQSPSPADGQPQAHEVSGTRALDTPMQALAGTPLLDQETYALLSEPNDDFELVQNKLGCATAAFLHALLDVVERHNYKTAWDLFQLVLTRKELKPVFTRAETIGVDQVVRMLKSLCLE